MALQKYRVNGSSETLGYEPGEEFEAELDPTLAKRLLEGGALNVLPATAPAKKPPASGSDARKEK